MIGRTLRGFIVKELKQTLRDPRMRVVLFVVPVLQTCLFGFALSMEVRRIRLAADVPPGDRLGQRIVERAFASGWFVPAEVAGREHFRWIESGKAEAVLIAPAGGVTKAAGRGAGEIQALIDGTNMLRAQSIERYLLAVLREAAQEEAAGLQPAWRPAVRISVRLLYNPAQVSAIFLIPGLIALILSIATIVMTAMSVAREKEMGTFEMLITAPVRRRDIVLGKTLPYALLACLDVPLILAAAVFVFRVPVRGPLWQLALGSGAFIFTAVSLGMLVSTYARNQQQALMGAFALMMPAVLLSGLYFPVENMPDVMQALTLPNPLRYFVALLRGVMLKGGEPGLFWPNFSAIAFIGAFTAALSIRRLRQTLN